MICEMIGGPFCGRQVEFAHAPAFVEFPPLVMVGDGVAPPQPAAHGEAPRPAFVRYAAAELSPFGHLRYYRHTTPTP